ncbi:tripartite-type tricarboxylate transporter receptor subunit TctC [Variovorax sp. TBS-050B]|uniref:Bug family tripartite tricarboxylate transporter substrate binding protein n=1 Tax=Variovorax sp. TBS-050B TaxID=2940551 RepID=UPI0024756816|nr:tripartite tricarboxylate transporter substrate binding protein [Variovorax sp. TBS-050B]MDH6590220.1 tripartite-type tricarboxylate transporter receptor subunit TctC [Variovorax sp. TBS-050B]
MNHDTTTTAATTLRRRTLLAGAAASFIALPARAQGQASSSSSSGAWPNRPIRFVVPGPAGAGSDIFARLLGVSLQAALGQPVVVDNKAGANGLIGNDAVAKSAGDGYTMLLAPSSAISINPIIQPKMPYDTHKDLVPVAQVGAAGILLIAHPSTGFKSLADMVRHAKANPDKLAYGSWGSGSTGHLAMEGIKAHYGLAMPHVPYKGAAQVVTDVLANNIGVAFADIASPVPHIRAGRLVALGCTGSARGPALPEVPTLTEQGYRFDVDGWYGVFVPAGTPREIVQRLNHEINRILASDDVIQKFAAQNMARPPIKNTEQFAATVREDIETWQRLAKVAKLKID